MALDAEEEWSDILPVRKAIAGGLASLLSDPGQASCLPKMKAATPFPFVPSFELEG